MENVVMLCYSVFGIAIADYHIRDDVDALMQNPYAEIALENILYEKCWIDTVQWHLEDMIRDPDIDCGIGLLVKRRIDRLNQKRTDTVELIDEYFQNKYGGIVPHPNARFNTESIGWALDRLSILSLKEFHLNVELTRNDATAAHISNCKSRQDVLIAQKTDLLKSIYWLIEEVEHGEKINKVYKQLKMYNDPSFNPVLYNRLEKRIG